MNLLLFPKMFRSKTAWHGHTYELRGMIWQQGEADTNAKNGHAQAYEKNLTDLILRVRKDLFEGRPAPFVVGGLSDSQDDDIRVPGTGWFLVRKAQETVAKTVPNVAFVNPLHLGLIAVLFFSAAAGARADEPSPAAAKDEAAFSRADAEAWREVFTDPGTGDWKQRWFLDGKVGAVKTGPEGMELTAGPEFKNNAHHMVLWTKQSFVGDLNPDYFPTGLFKKGVPHKITVIKKARDLFMRVENAGQTYFCHMANPDLPEITQGRIGLRHMFTRSARYRNFRVSTTNPEPDDGGDDPSKAAADRPAAGRYADHEKLVAETHEASLKTSRQGGLPVRRGKATRRDDPLQRGVP